MMSYFQSDPMVRDFIEILIENSDVFIPEIVLKKASMW